MIELMLLTHIASGVAAITMPLADIQQSKSTPFRNKVFFSAVLLLSASGLVLILGGASITHACVAGVVFASISVALKKLSRVRIEKVARLKGVS